MTMTPSPVQIAVDRMLRLICREASLREAGRHLELNPSTTDEAAWLFARADETRRERLELMARVGLT